jgi:hypothetical protein
MSAKHKEAPASSTRVPYERVKKPAHQNYSAYKANRDEDYKPSPLSFVSSAYPDDDEAIRRYVDPDRHETAREVAYDGESESVATSQAPTTETKEVIDEGLVKRMELVALYNARTDDSGMPMFSVTSHATEEYQDLSPDGAGKSTRKRQRDEWDERLNKRVRAEEQWKSLSGSIELENSCHSDMTSFSAS